MLLVKFIFSDVFFHAPEAHLLELLLQVIFTDGFGLFLHSSELGN